MRGNARVEAAWEVSAARGGAGAVREGTGGTDARNSDQNVANGKWGVRRERILDAVNSPPQAEAKKDKVLQAISDCSQYPLLGPFLTSVLLMWVQLPDARHSPRITEALQIPVSFNGSVRGAPNRSRRPGAVMDGEFRWLCGQQVPLPQGYD